MSSPARTPKENFDLAMANAVSRHRVGDVKGAEPFYREALGYQPQQGDALRLLGGLLLQNQRMDEAVAVLRQALAAQPGNPEISENLGIALRDIGLGFCRADEPQKAIELLQEAAALSPKDANALGNLGLALHQAGRYRQAEEAFRHALALQPDSIPALVNLSTVLRDLGEREAAVDHLLKARQLSPEMAEIHINLGVAYLECHKFAQSLASCDEALQLSPNDPAAMVNRGIALYTLGRLDEAEECFHAVLRRDPGDAQALINLGWLARERGELGAALDYYERALAIKPKLQAAIYRKALVLLARGDYAEGWRLYEAGRNQPSLRGLDLFTAKPWDGRKVKRLLIWSEQGFGDSLHFVRYAALCKAFAERVIVLCPTALLRLYRNSPGIDGAYDTIDDDQYDAQIAMISLPHLLGTTMETVPATVPYLAVSAACQAKWSARIADNGRLKVGLVWAGDARKVNGEANLIDRRRSMNLAALHRLLDREGVDFYSLQKGPPAAQIHECGLAERIVDLMPEVEDFMDTAAIINQLDLVIAVDTSVAHLAGGLGKPVWILSRFDACWRWLQNRPDNPWYPTARIFGQPKPGDWDSVVGEVDAALAKFIPPHARI